LIDLAELKKSHIEIFFIRSSTNRLKGGGKARISVEHVKDAGFAIRVLKRGRVGTASATLPLHEGTVENLFNEAIRNIEVKRARKYELEQFPAYGKSDGDSNSVFFNHNIIRMTEDDLIDLMTQLASVAYMVPGGQNLLTEVGQTIEHVRIVNSNGCDKFYTVGMLGGRMMLSVEREGKPSIGYTERYTRDKLNVQQIGAESLLLAEMNRQKQLHIGDSEPSASISGEVTMIWSSKALAEILSFTLVPVLRSKSFLRLNHPFFSSQENLVASDILNVFDDPNKRYGLGSSPFDDTGNVIERWDLIKKGSRVHFLSDLGRQSLFRKAYFERRSHSYRYQLGIFPTNLVISMEEEHCVDNIIEHCRSGLYIGSVTGAHSSNPETGHFSVELTELYLVKNGMLERPVAAGELHGNLFSLIRNICLGSKISSEIKPINAPYAINIPEVLISCPKEDITLLFHPVKVD